MDNTRAFQIVWDEALDAIDMATLLDPADPEVRAAGEPARETPIGLEAAPFVGGLNAAPARGPGPIGRPVAVPRLAPADASVKTPWRASFRAPSHVPTTTLFGSTPVSGTRRPRP